MSIMTARMIEILSTDSSDIVDKKLELPVRLLSEGNAIAIPTETVYGLAANALCSKAIEKIFDVKGRPKDNPLIVHVSDMDMLNSIVESSSAINIYASLMERFWPGPITFLFPKSRIIPDIVTAGQETVAIRMPSHPIARRIIKLCNFPLAAPSANLSGHTSPTLASHVFHDLGDRIPCIVDAGACQSGLESTVITLIHDPPKILRPGGITFEMLIPFVPRLTIHQMLYEKLDPKSSNNETCEESPLSPGMKYIHYSPRAKLILLKGESMNTKQIEELDSFIANPFISNNRKLRIGCLLTKYDRILNRYSNNIISFCLGQNEECTLSGIARDLFAGMRLMDSYNVDIILIEELPSEREGLAIMNRVSKASSLILPSSLNLLKELEKLE